MLKLTILFNFDMSVLYNDIQIEQHKQPGMNFKFIMSQSIYL